IGDGHAGGTAHRGEASRLTDAAGTGYGQYFKYYMPGVGTPFAEVGDLDYSTVGLAGSLLAAVQAMGTWPGLGFVNGQANRAAVFSKQLKAIEQPLRFALTQPGHGTPRLLGLKL
ncbi:hypothetical protein A252_27029, partial [Pseudomonas syringae pv. actinidiae ICMP 9855]